MHQDPLDQVAAAADMDEAVALPAFVERTIGELLRKAMTSCLTMNVVPDVSIHISRIVDVIVLRRATLSHGLCIEKSVICGIFKRIVQFRGHLEPQSDALLPPTWLQQAATSMHHWMSTIQGYLGNDVATYHLVQGVWVQYQGAGAMRAQGYRGRVQKREREAAQTEVMTLFMKNWMDARAAPQPPQIIYVNAPVPAPAPVQPPTPPGKLKAAPPVLARKLPAPAAQRR